MKKNLFALLAFMVFMQAHQMHNEHISENSSKVLTSMHKAMMSADFSQSGNLEKDFLSNMIPHHQGAIDSSKELLLYSTNAQVRAYAEGIIKAQEQEIAEFKNLLQNLNITSKNPASKEHYTSFIQKEQANMNEMMHKMHTVSPSSNLDKDFLEAMIAHHQGAIDSSKNFLMYSKDKKIRAIAEKIIKDQEQEIAEFKELVKDMK